MHCKFKYNFLPRTAPQSPYFSVCFCVLVLAPKHTHVQQHTPSSGPLVLALLVAGGIDGVWSGTDLTVVILKGTIEMCQRRDELKKDLFDFFDSLAFIDGPVGVLATPVAFVGVLVVGVGASMGASFKFESETLWDSLVLATAVSDFAGFKEGGPVTELSGLEDARAGGGAAPENAASCSALRVPAIDFDFAPPDDAAD
jgi:hypothetical protein